MDVAPLWQTSLKLPSVRFLVVVVITLYLFIHYKWVLFLVPKVFARNNLTFLKCYFILKDRLLHIYLFGEKQNFIYVYLKV